MRKEEKRCTQPLKVHSPVVYTCEAMHALVNLLLITNQKLTSTRCEQVKYLHSPQCKDFSSSTVLIYVCLVAIYVYQTIFPCFFVFFTFHCYSFANFPSIYLLIYLSVLLSSGISFYMCWFSARRVHSLIKVFHTRMPCAPLRDVSFTFTSKSPFQQGYF